jgi:two-component system chemotaxis response regulator CheY
MPNSAIRFLVVDAHSTMRRIVINLLRDGGYDEVDEADDSPMALHKLRTSRFDFVICATELATEGGLQLLGHIKKDATLRHIPVLLVTAEPRREDIVLAGQLGASGYVVKPFTKAILEDRVIRIVKRLGLK